MARFHLFNAVVILVFLCSCKGNFQSPKNTIITVLASPVATIDPLFSTDAASQRINQLVHAALVKTNEELLPSAQLAEKFSIINDTTVEFLLKKGCKFQNNREITSKDVENSLKIFLNPEYNSLFLSSFQNIKNIEIIDKYNFRIHTRLPQANLLYDLSLLKILPIEEYNPKAFQSSPIGAGPYKVIDFSSKGIRLERFDTGCFPLPPTPYIQAKVIRDDLSRFLKLRNGELDIILNDLDYRKVLQIKNEHISNLQTIVADGTSYSYLGLNFANPNLKKIEVRKAIAHAINIAEIIEYKLVGFAHPSSTIIPPNNWFFEKSLTPYTYDPSLAKKLLDQAGYYNGENNKPVLTLELKTTTFKPIMDNARAITEQLKAVGIQIHHKAYEWGTFYSDLKSRNTELFLSRWVGVSSPDIIADIFHSKKLQENNRTNYSNSELDNILDQASSTMNQQTRKQLFQKAQKIIYNDLPYISLWHNMNFAVFRSNLKNVTLHPNGDWDIFLKINKLD